MKNVIYFLTYYNTILLEFLFRKTLQSSGLESNLLRIAPAFSGSKRQKNHHKAFKEIVLHLILGYNPAGTMDWRLSMLQQITN